MLRYIPLIIFISLFFISCESTAKPVIYNRDIATIDKDSEIIQILIKNENLLEAEKQIDNKLILYPDNLDILLLKAWLLLQQDKVDDSEKLFLKIIEKSRKNPLALNGLARVERRKGNIKESLQYINEGLGYLPTNSFLWHEKGIIEYESNDFKKAYVDFSKAYSLDTKNYEAYFFKYITLLKLNKEIDEVKQYWDFLIKKKELQSWYFQYHADILYGMKYKDYAMTVVKQGLDFFPNDPYLLNMSASYLTDSYNISNDKETLDQARANIIKCIGINKELKPEFVDTYFIVLEKNNEIDLLKKEIVKYKMVFPESALIAGWEKKYLSNKGK